MRYILITLALTAQSCMFWDIPPVIDPPEPIQIDCDGYQAYDDPFMTANVIFDVWPDTIVFVNNSNDTVDIGNYFDDYAVYHTNKYLTVIVWGQNAYTGKTFFVWDGTGARHPIYFGERRLRLKHATTYEQTKTLFDNSPSALYLSCNGMNWDSLQIDTLVGLALDTCVAGGIQFDLRNVPISQSRLDQCLAHGWDWVLTN